MSNNTFIPSNIIDQLIGFNSSTNEIKTLSWLIDSGYGGNTIVYSIINKIVTTSLTVPLIVVDSEGEEVENSPIYDILDRPAIYQGEYLSTKEWIEYSMTYLLTSGNLFQRKSELVGINEYPLEIIPSQLVTPETSNSYLTHVTGYTINDLQRTTPVSYEDMVHTKYINPTSNGLATGLGLSPLQAALLSLKGNSEVQQALAVMIGNQGVRGILSPENGGLPADGNLLKRWAAEIRDKLTGVKKINSVHISNTMLKYYPMGLSTADLQLLESGILTDRQLCNAYAVDSKLFNDPESSTFNNLSEATKGLYENAILPGMDKVLGSFNTVVSDNLARGQKVIADTSKITALQPNKKEEAEKNKSTALAIKEILGMNTDKGSKIESLIYVLGMSEEVATKIVGNGNGGDND